MTQDLAVDTQSQKYDLSLFDEVESSIRDTVPEEFVETDFLMARFEELKECFEADCQRIDEVSELIFGDETAAYGDRTTAVFARWGEEKGGPSMTAIISFALSYFDIDRSSSLARACFVAAILAEIPNDLQYHGNEHYRKVLFHALRLAVTYNIINKGTEKELSQTQLAALLVAACIHDLGHKGGDNQNDGIYTPGSLEQRSVNIARPYLEAADPDRDFIGEIETMVFCTDITFFAGENSPCIRMKKIYRHLIWGDDSEDVSMMMMGKLRRYEDNPVLAEMSMMLHEADVGSSAGLSYEQTIKETIDIMEERGVTTAGPKVVLAFLREQLGESMFTEAARQVFGSAMDIVIAQAEKDVLAGRETFYED